MVSGNKDKSRLAITITDPSVRDKGFIIIDAVVLGLNYWLSIFFGQVFIVDFFLQTFHIIKGKTKITYI